FCMRTKDGMSPCRIIYLSADGLLEPIGQSQVVNLAVRLADKGMRLNIVSLERESDLRDEKRRKALQDLLARHDVRWTYSAYRSASGWRRPLIIHQNSKALFKLASTELTNNGICLIHARSYLA